MIDKLIDRVDAINKDIGTQDLIYDEQDNSLMIENWNGCLYWSIENWYLEFKDIVAELNVNLLNFHFNDKTKSMMKGIRQPKEINLSSILGTLNPLFDIYEKIYITKVDNEIKIYGIEK